MARRIQPGSLVDSNCVDDELLSVPMADGMAHPLGVFGDVFRMFRTVQIDDSINSLVFEQNCNHVIVLYQLKWRRRLKASCRSYRKAESIGVVRGIDFLESFCSKRSKRNHFTLGESAAQIRRIWSLPYTV